jgi:integral membrane protein
LNSNPIHHLRIAGLVEAVSYMLLVGIAMPLKYIWHMPKAVSVIGMLHGVLFIIFCIALARATLAAKWPLARAALLFIASLLPFGPFLLDKRLRQWQSEFTVR